MPRRSSNPSRRRSVSSEPPRRSGSPPRRRQSKTFRPAAAGPSPSTSPSNSDAPNAGRNVAASASGEPPVPRRSSSPARRRSVSAAPQGSSSGNSDGSSSLATASGSDYNAPAPAVPRRSSNPARIRNAARGNQTRRVSQDVAMAIATVENHSRRDMDGFWAKIICVRLSSAMSLVSTSLRSVPFSNKRASKMMMQ